MKKLDLTQSLGNGIKRIVNPNISDTVLAIPTQTEPAKSLYKNFPSGEITLNKDGNLILNAQARPNKQIFGEFASIDKIKDGDLESRMYRVNELAPVDIAKIYTEQLEVYKTLLENIPSSNEEVAIPNYLNVKAIDTLNDDYNQLFLEIDQTNKDWKESKTRIRGFIAGLREKTAAKKEGKQPTISKTQLEITKHLKWILAGAKHKPLGATAQSIISYAQDVLIPHLTGKEVFDQENLNTNFFSIGQFWSYKDEIGRLTYTPLTVNNLDTGYLPHSLEVRLLLDAIKNCGPRLLDIQSTYGLLLPAIKNSIHAKALNQGGMNYNRPKVEDQIRITLNTLLTGFYNDLVNDFCESGASEMGEKQEILDWVLSLFEA